MREELKFDSFCKTENLKIITIFLSSTCAKCYVIRVVQQGPKKVYAMFTQPLLRDFLKVISLEKLSVLISIVYNYTAEASIFLPWGNTS